MLGRELGHVERPDLGRRGDPGPDRPEPGGPPLRRRLRLVRRPRRRARAAAAGHLARRWTPRTRSRSGTAGHPIGRCPDMAFSVEGNVYVATYLIYTDAADDERYRSEVHERPRPSHERVASASTSATPTSPGAPTASSATSTSPARRRSARTRDPRPAVRVVPRLAAGEAERPWVKVTRRLDHVGLNVADLVAAEAWYAVAFDYEREFVVRLDAFELDIVMLIHPVRGDRLELLHRPGSQAGLRAADAPEAVLTQGFGHVAFDVSDLDEHLRAPGRPRGSSRADPAALARTRCADGLRRRPGGQPAGAARPLRRVAVTAPATAPWTRRSRRRATSYLCSRPSPRS